MADFRTPFSNTGSRRVPTADEKANGFPCGPADQRLFNGLLHRIEAELGDLINHAGLTGSDADNTQVRQAILALISSATGGGDSSQFLLLSQASARLPIYPEILSADGKMNVSSPASGTVRLPGGVNWMRRGIVEMTTVETDFPTALSRTYHLRWDATNGYRLLDLTDVTYNPSISAENHTDFDTTYDDMLIARVITNSSNVPTITNLVNKPRLISETEFDRSLTNTGANWADLTSTSVNLDWSRAPDLKTLAMNSINSNSSVWEEYGGGDLGKIALRNKPVSRYGSGDVEYGYDDSAGNFGRVKFTRTFVSLS